MHNRGKITSLLLGDLILLYLALWLTLILRYYPQDHYFQLGRHIIPFSVVFFVWILFFGAFGLYDLRFIKNSRAFIYRLVWVSFINAVLAALIFYSSLPIVEIEPRRNLLIITSLSIIFISLWRYVFNILAVRTPADRVVFFGVNKETLELIDYLIKNPQLGQKPAALIIETPPPGETLPLPTFVFNPKNFVETVRAAAADTIVISPLMKENRALVGALFPLIPLGVRIIEFPAFYEMLTGKIPLFLIEEVWFLENLIGKGRPRYEFAKRLLDILAAGVLGGITLVFLPFIACGILMSRLRDLWRYREKRARPGDGMIFFRQKRVGKNGRVFDFIKFRSQVLGAEKMSEAKAMDGDSRQYTFGKFLRRFYLDELPQVWNILKGEMSFVGPRPERPEYVEKLKERVSFYEMRLLAKPGLTGWAQINMENDASVEDAPEKMQYDLYYVKNQSVWLDLVIVLRTVFIMLGRRGR